MKKVAMLVAVLTMSALPAFAHHGWGGNEDKLTDVTGTVTTAVSLAGPHGTMKIKDAQGNTWDVTMAPPNRTQQAGVSDKAIPVGATVTVHGHRNKNMKTYEIKVTKVTYNGKVFDVYPGME